MNDIFGFDELVEWLDAGCMLMWHSEITPPSDVKVIRGADMAFFVVTDMIERFDTAKEAAEKALQTPPTTGKINVSRWMSLE